MAWMRIVSRNIDNDKTLATYLSSELDRQAVTKIMVRDNIFSRFLRANSLAQVDIGGCLISHSPQFSAE